MIGRRGVALLLLLASGAAVTGRCLAAESPAFLRARAEMVVQQLAGRDIRDPLVLRAMGRVPRHLFVPAALAALAYADRPLPIPDGQTISQPYVVALMTELLELRGGERVLEVGTGSGYQAAVLAEITPKVWSIEILPGLAASAAARLAALGYGGVQVRTGDGYRGWPEAAPFDAIVVTAAATHVPAPLVEQLAEGGRLVLPVGPEPGFQELLQGRKQGGRLHTRIVAPVRFVPLVEPKH
ncbi:MAG TPA: protein-L-isoaspartate(D-aspartate) O-methyltransferase [Candidatus Sulfotelmatobacter sp.]|nr:protein-L-isoaspartate(D-aspartate) O-methyltransferase [Candidatus Sulfotelmatobacter sp.]